MKNTQKLMAVIVIGLYFTLTAASTPKPTTTCDRALEDQNLPHQSDCSKYYRCVYGKKVPKECPEKMLFNPFIGNCDLYYNVECPHDHQTPNDDDDVLAQALDNLAGRTFVRNPKISKPSATPRSATSNSVDTSTIKFVYVPHDKDQSAYYRIENREKLLLHCEEGKVFSVELEICARPWTLK